MCSIDGLYYKDEKSFVVCSNGYASYQPCPPGTKTDKFPSYTAGYYYGSSDLCTMNLVDYGFSPYSYMPHVVSHDKKPHTSYEVIIIVHRQKSLSTSQRKNPANYGRPME